MRYAVILAGGSGTRLWPWSRAHRPKQLLPLADGRSLLEAAFERLRPLVAPECLFVSAGQVFEDDICARLDLPHSQFIGEPVGRDTAAALGYCAAVLARRDPEAVFAVATADHLIEPPDQFRETLAAGFALAETRPHALLTFGVAPDAASTAYGYLELGEVVGAARSVARFLEKPDAALAEEFLAAGPDRYLWNSGMFVWRAATLLDCLEAYRPSIAAAVKSIAASLGAPDHGDCLARIYPRIEKVSVDYAVMEPASRDREFEVLALPLCASWRDIGSWNAFAETCPRDEAGNALAAARHVVIDSRGTLVASDDPGHLVAAIGCDGLMIVHTKDATLVCRADKAQDVKQLQEIVRRQHAGFL